MGGLFISRKKQHCRIARASSIKEGIGKIWSRRPLENRDNVEEHNNGVAMRGGGKGERKDRGGENLT